MIPDTFHSLYSNIYFLFKCKNLDVIASVFFSFWLQSPQYFYCGMFNFQVWIPNALYGEESRKVLVLRRKYSNIFEELQLPCSSHNLDECFSVKPRSKSRESNWQKVVATHLKGRWTVLLYCNFFGYQHMLSNRAAHARQ